MENRINTLVAEWSVSFKESIIQEMNTYDKNKPLEQHMQKIITYLYDYEKLRLKKEHFQKRKRARNVVPFHERCIACRAKGDQCTRSKKGDHDFCGTHLKGTPHGVITQDGEIPVQKDKKLTIHAEEIKGIMYFIDNDCNVYSTEDVQSNTVNPKIIAKYSKTPEGEITIPELFSL